MPLFGKKKAAPEIHPNSTTVCDGKYTIHRLSADAFLKRIETMQGLMAYLMMLNDSNGLIGVLDATVKTRKAKDISGALLNLGVEAVEAIMDVLCEYTGISPEAMRNDPDIGFGGIGEILAAVIEVNGIDRFFTSAFPALRNVWKGIAQDPEKAEETAITNR